jgi:hypothetical protein
MNKLEKKKNFSITDEMNCGFNNHNISMDVEISYKNMNGVIYETREKNINCNSKEMKNFFELLKKQIQLLDETKGDSIGDGSGGF